MRDLDQRAELKQRRTSSWTRTQPLIAVAIAAASYALMPQELLLAPRYLIPVLEVALGIALAVTTTQRLSARSTWSRRGSLFLAGLVIISNLGALGLLVTTLSDPGADAMSLLVGGMQVWLTNVIGFGLLYWELDRGGPIARRQLLRPQLPPADWRFAQDENHETITEVARGSSEHGWIPQFVDYQYLSLTNSSAFSPTDTMPLSTRAKLLMGLQASAALLVSLLIVARAVGSLGG